MTNLREQSLFKLSDEAFEWHQSNALLGDWCWSQCVCVCVCVCVCGGGGVCECVCEESEGQSSMVHGAKERERGEDGRELSFLTA